MEVRKTIGRLRNCIKLLAHHSIMISPTSVMAAFDLSIEQEYEVNWSTLKNFFIFFLVFMLVSKYVRTRFSYCT